MIYCINPHCQHRQNSDDQEICESCGTPLIIEGRYRLTKPLRPLESRTTTDVFEVQDRQSFKVIKVLKEFTPDAFKALEREAFTLQCLPHPSVPRVGIDDYFTVFVEAIGQDVPCLIMEKIEGQTLEQWIATHGPISQSLAVEWLKQLIQILEALHTNHFFHRDIKPSNIMLRPNGQLVLIDFGSTRGITYTYMGKVNVGRLTSVFSSGYTPPEQIRGQAVPQSDFYALGRTFVHLMTGIPPFELSDDPRTRSLSWRRYAPQISGSLAQFIDELMAENSADRPQNTTFLLSYLSKKYLFYRNFVLLWNSRRVRTRFKIITLVFFAAVVLFQFLQPSISQYYLDLGNQALNQGQLNKAKKNYETALKFNKRDSRIYNNLGFICQQEKNQSCALIQYEKASRLDPKNPVTRYYLGSLQEDLGDFAAATVEYKVAAQSEGLIAANALSDLARLQILDQQTENAFPLINRGLEKAIDNSVRATLYKNRGWAHFELGHYPEAKLDLEKAIELNPTQTDSYCLLAQVLEGQSQQDAALSMWKNCLKTGTRDDLEIKIWQGIARQRLQKEKILNPIQSKRSI